MGSFEDVLINVKSMFGTAKEKVGKIVDVSKLRIASAEIHNQISKKLEQVGQIVYKDHKQEKNASDLTPLFKEIDELYISFHAVKERIAFINNKVKCPKCNFINNRSSVFCNECGSKLLEEETNEAE
jgi:uncharacterized protein YjbJ (UPF0337 family)